MKLTTAHLKNKGFTLIELLVVIAVLGVLAAGVLVAINPLQRINQANDATSKNNVGQIAQAEQAFFTTSQYYAAVPGDLVTSSDLKVEPKTSTGASYSMKVNPVGCTTALKTCTDVAVYYTLLAPAVAGNVWCWRSSTGVAAEITLAACTAP